MRFALLQDCIPNLFIQLMKQLSDKVLLEEVNSTVIGTELNMLRIWEFWLHLNNAS